MAVWYLDTDDEITDAVARLRQVLDERVVFVVPPGSRIATGRINFRLLAREAESRGKAMAIASPDEQVRAMAASAGVITAASAEAAEAALERGEEPPEPSTPPTAGATLAATVAEPAARSLSWRSQRVRLATLGTLVLAVVGAYVAAQTLPTAEITLTPRTTQLGPLEMTVVALPGVAEPEPEAGRIPAVEVSVPLEVDAVFAATGSETVETRATGEVVFSAPEQPIVPEISAGTRVRTPSGIEFQTTAAATLPRADDGPSQVSAPIEAVRPGEEGNVEAEAISMSPSLEGRGISVTNPRPTSGGRFEQTPRVTAEDYDGAAVELENRLAGALEAYRREPTDVPAGVTVYPETARLGPVTYEPPFDALVGSSEAEFRLGGSAVAEVLAVEESLVETIVRTRLQAAVPEGRRLLAESVEVAHEAGQAEGQRILFGARASGLTYPRVDTAALAEQVAGLPISEARSILEAIGQATVNVWPDFLGDLPGDHQRITIDVIEPSIPE